MISSRYGGSQLKQPFDTSLQASRSVTQTLTHTHEERYMRESVDIMNHVYIHVTGNFSALTHAKFTLIYSIILFRIQCHNTEYCDIICFKLHLLGCLFRTTQEIGHIAYNSCRTHDRYMIEYKDPGVVRFKFLSAWKRTELL